MIPIYRNVGSVSGLAVWLLARVTHAYVLLSWLVSEGISESGVSGGWRLGEPETMEQQPWSLTSTLGALASFFSTWRQVDGNWIHSRKVSCWLPGL